MKRNDFILLIAVFTYSFLFYYELPGINYLLFICNAKCQHYFHRGQLHFVGSAIMPKCKQALVRVRGVGILHLFIHVIICLHDTGYHETS